MGTGRPRTMLSDQEFGAIAETLAGLVMMSDRVALTKVMMPALLMATQLEPMEIMARLRDVYIQRVHATYRALNEDYLPHERAILKRADQYYRNVLQLVDSGQNFC